MSTPVRYGQHRPLAPRTRCNVCGSKPDKPVMDHCHEHGWVRGAVCSRCNSLMALIDRKITPLAGGANEATLLGLLMHFGLCPDCPPLMIDDLTGTRSLSNLNRKSTPHAVGALMPVGQVATFRRLAEIETEGNVSQMIRKLLTEALAARARGGKA